MSGSGLNLSLAIVALAVRDGHIQEIRPTITDPRCQYGYPAGLLANGALKKAVLIGRFVLPGLLLHSKAIKQTVTARAD